MSWECSKCGKAFESRKALSDHLQTHEEGEEKGKEVTITVDNLREKKTSSGGLNYQIWSDSGEMYSTFDKPELWDQMRIGDKILLRFVQSGKFKNLVEGSIEVLESSGQPKQQRQIKQRSQPSGGQRGRKFGTRELAVKWVLEAASRTLQHQEDLTEDKLTLVLDHYATYAQTELLQFIEQEEEESND